MIEQKNNTYDGEITEQDVWLENAGISDSLVEPVSGGSHDPEKIKRVSRTDNLDVDGRERVKKCDGGGENSPTRLNMHRSREDFTTKD